MAKEIVEMMRLLTIHHALEDVVATVVDLRNHGAVGREIKTVTEIAEVRHLLGLVVFVALLVDGERQSRGVGVPDKAGD